MPIAIALAAELAGMAAEAAGAAALEAGASMAVALAVSNIAFYAAQVGISLAVTIGLEAAFRPRIPSPEGAKTTFRQARPPKQRGYGQYRVSGPAALYESYKNTLFQVVPINDGRIESFDSWFLHDDEVTFANAQGFQGGEVKEFPSGRYPTNHVGIFWRFGLVPETIYPGPHNVLPGQWAATARGDGTASFLLSCTGDSASKQQKSYPFGQPNPSTVITASVVWDWRDPAQARSDESTWRGTGNPVVALADYLVGPIGGGMGLDFDRLIAPVLDLWTTAANVCDEQIEVINWSTFLVQAQVAGATYMVVASAAGVKAGTVIFTGVESITVTSVGSDPFGVRINFNRGLTFSYQQRQWLQWQVLDGTATQPRYSMGGYYTYDNDPADVVAQFLQCFDGWFSQDTQGHLILYAGKYVAPGAGDTIPSAAIVGYELKPYLEDELAVNSLMLAFNDPAHQWAMTDTNPWLEEADILQRGVERPQDMKLPWVHYNSQARRLAKRAGSRFVQPNGKLFLNLAGLAFLGRRYLALSIDELISLTNVVIEVRKASIDLAALQVTLEFVIADPEVDSWNPAVEEGNGPGIGTRATPTPNPQPTIVSVTPEYVQSTGEGSGTELVIVAESPLGDGLDWVVQVSKSGQNEWLQFNNTIVPASVTNSDVVLITGFVPTGALDVQVAYATGGSLSPFSAVSTLTVEPPSVNSVVATATQDIPAGSFVYVFGTPAQMSLASAASGGLPANAFVLDHIANGATGTAYFSGLDSAAAVTATSPVVWLSDTTPGGYMTAAPSSPSSITQTLGPAINGVGVAFNAGVPTGETLNLNTEEGQVFQSEDGQNIQEENP